jgi:hypothetical protein
MSPKFDNSDIEELEDEALESEAEPDWEQSAAAEQPGDESGLYMASVETADEDVREEENDREEEGYVATMA